ncbi:ABC transporter permease [Streptomyces sp. NPDC059396]|uniref:ABC transporter permease n=1 Tax=Streptomyces sp. NPDC059396 TaxID=3346819 RepID=UPI003684E44F
MSGTRAVQRPGSAEGEGAKGTKAVGSGTGRGTGNGNGTGPDLTRLDLLLKPPRARTGWRVLPARVMAMCAVELQKLRHDRTELYTRAIQPALWLLIFGETFTRIKAIPTGGIPYIDFLAPGIIAQSAMFIAIFYGIMIIWERDAGILTKLLVTPTPRAALISGKAFASGVKALIQAVVVILIAAALGVGLTWNPLKLLGVAVAVVLGSAFFSCLSMTIAGIVLTRDRLMGIGQAITMPLFFASNALYPVAVMPDWLQVISKINPLSYQVDALRGLLLGTPSHLLLDYGVLVFAAVVGIMAASSLLGRLAR